MSTPPVDTRTEVDPKFTKELHHPSCRPYDVALVWHCSQCGLNEMAEEIDSRLAALREQLASAEQQLLNREQRWEESERIRERAEQQLAEANRQLEIKRGTIKKLGEQLAKHPGWEPDSALAASAQKAGQQQSGGADGR